MHPNRPTSLNADAASITTSRHRPNAFTMLEVLISMGIFAVGFVAVAAIFPTAVLLQKKTVDDVVAQQVARNAQALLEARGLKLGLALPTHDGYLFDQMDGAGYTTWDTDQRVYPLPRPLLVSGYDFLTPTTAPPERWLISDRSYPSSSNPPENRKLFWVPLVRDSNSNSGVTNTDVTIYVFILQRGDGSTYPRPDLTPANWVNFYDGYVDNAPLGPTPDANDNWSVPGVTMQPVTVSPSNLARYVFTGGNSWAGGLKVNVGDQILDSYGGIHTITSADATGVNIEGFITPNLDTGQMPTEIWFAHPDQNGRQRPTQRILVLTKAVQP